MICIPFGILIPTCRFLASLDPLLSLEGIADNGHLQADLIRDPLRFLTRRRTFQFLQSLSYLLFILFTSDEFTRSQLIEKLLGLGDEMPLLSVKAKPVTSGSLTRQFKRLLYSTSKLPIGQVLFWLCERFLPACRRLPSNSSNRSGRCMAPTRPSQLHPGCLSGECYGNARAGETRKNGMESRFSREASFVKRSGRAAD